MFTKYSVLRFSREAIDSRNVVLLLDLTTSIFSKPACFLVNIEDLNSCSEEQTGSPHWGVFKKLQLDSRHRLHKE